jgi:C1A family cysteine protease
MTERMAQPVVAGKETRTQQVSVLPGGGAFIFRNSWGRDWARLRGRHGGGYGTLFFDYLRDNVLEGYC